jgi:acyl-homoserine-lactone acylase
MRFSRRLAAVLLAAPLAVPMAMAHPAKAPSTVDRVTITRDEWGIAHVSGQTDADAVYGMIYAQAEDDFPRIERNYLVNLGRLSEAEGESAIWQDLRQRLFIDPDRLKADYAQSPLWLRKLMQAWADGLNAWLADHPKAKPLVLTHFEPWMALSFSEGSTRRAKESEGRTCANLQAFQGSQASGYARRQSGAAMASFHLAVKAIGRSAGRSATAAAAYRAGVEITDERTGARPRLHPQGVERLVAARCAWGHRP